MLHAAPRAVIETGTFRGISTAWLAAHCDAPVWSCEVEEVYLLQAHRRLAEFDNVILEHSDSRTFLRRVVSLLKADRPSFFYLDAHWKDDLPLRDEIGIIFAAQPRAVIMIDDFRIPEDTGYAWDDYGPGVRVDATALVGVLPEGASLYVPVLPSQKETGAKRGCCVIALDTREAVDRCTLLRRRSLSDLMPQEFDGISPSTGELHPSMLQNGQADDLLVSSLRDEIAKTNLDRAKRLQDIAALHRMVSAAEEEGRLLKAESEIRLRDIETLTREILAARARIEEIEADRAQRLTDNQSLSALVSRYEGELNHFKSELAQRGGR